MPSTPPGWWRRSWAALLALGLVAGVGAVVTAAPALASTSTATFSYSTSVQTWTVPTGVTAVTVSMKGGEGGRGGNDATASTPGSYFGMVTGTLAVTPGQVLTIGVGKGGGAGGSGNHNATLGAGGTNPLGSVWAGGTGGAAGSAGSSGAGGGGGAATVLTVGSTTLVAAGSGGGGGSGQYGPLTGRTPYSTHSPRTDATSSNGQPGLAVNAVCTTSCDGGGSGGGGGGLQGGARGNIEFGTGSYTEWFGYGGYPGQLSTANQSELTSYYQYTAANSGNGTVTLSWSSGPPSAPTGLSGAAAQGSVALTWTAPTDSGLSAVSDYVVEHALASAPTSWTTFADGTSSATSATVTGLTNGTEYVFRVAGVNTAGTGAWSASSGSVVPSDVPSAPAVTSVTGADASLSVAFTAADSHSPVVDNQVQVDGGDWVSVGLTSPVTVRGLVNGIAYSVALRAVNAIGTGPASTSVSGTPQAPPGAPSITSVTTSPGTAVVSFTAGFSGGQEVTGYEYRLGSGNWTSAGTTTSPVTIPGLADGTSYLVSLRALTADGPGAASAASSFATPGVPAAPTVTSVARGDRALTVSFTAGAHGGSPITAYQVRTGEGEWTAVPSGISPFVLAGLSNGTTYAVQVRAINAVGPGSASTAVSGTPATLPGAPVIVGGTVSGDTGVLLAAFTAPASDGGAAVTTYEYSTDAGATWRARAEGTTESPLSIAVRSDDGAALVPGTSYPVELRAVNAVGPGLASATADGTVAASPSAPTGLQLVAAPSSLQVSFVPGANGGAAITRYEYRLGSGDAVTTGSLGSSFVVANLTDGTAYALQVRAVNAAGAGAWSEVATGTPRSAPRGAIVTGVSRADRSLTLLVEVAAGGSAPTGWEYSTDGGLTWATASTATSPLVVTTLSSGGGTVANGTGYPVSVRAVNAAGTGPASVTTTVAPAGAPTTPTASLEPQNAAIQVSFVVPSDNGSEVSAIEYRLDDGEWTSTGSLSSPFTVPGLTNGTAYAVQVRARNAIDYSAASTSASVTPRTVPSGAQSVAVAGDGGRADVTWTAPASNGGAAVTGYVASAYASSTATPAIATCSTVTTGCTITGLTNGTSYYVSVVASNAAGAGTASSPRVLVTPLARPAAPTLGTLSSGDAYLSVPFTAGSAGSSAITGYEYRLNGGTWVAASGTSTPITISGLTNGTSYAVTLRAVSAIGKGDVSGTSSATPYTVPAQPAASTIVADGQNGSIAVSWAAVSNNGSAITQYSAVAWNAASLGSQVQTCTTTGALTCTLSGLSNGTTYYVSVQATNAAGASLRSDRIASIPSLLPGAVPAPTGVPGDGQVALTWAAGSTGASAISDYVVSFSANGGSTWTTFADGTSSSRTATVTGLTNGTAYLFRLSAVNGSGTGPVGVASAAVTPRTVPGAPTSLVATPGNGTVALTWAAPSSTGGSPIVGYVVTPSSGSPITVSTPTTSLTVTGLVNGTAYTFTVAALNIDGAGVASAASTAVTPVTTPSAPTITSVSPAEGTAVLVWTAPVSTGGSPLTGYVITPSTGVPVAVGNVLTYELTGLSSDTALSFTVAAVNAVGTGSLSAASNPVVPASVPSAPGNAGVTPGNGSATVTWSAPLSTGGSPVTGYVITPSEGSPVSVGSVSTAVITGLTNGRSYTFTVAAVNAIGTGPASAALSAVTPRTVPSAPVITAVTPGDSRVALSWAAPSSNGGSPVTGYVITPSSGAPITVGAVTAYEVTGLANGVAVTFTVAAINVAGGGAGSAVSAPVLPRTVAGAPTATAAQREGADAVITWEPPGTDGGAPATGYVVRWSCGTEGHITLGDLTVGDVRRAVVPGLPRRVLCTFTVAAVNAGGVGPASEVALPAVARVTPEAPATPVLPVVPAPVAPVIDPVPAGETPAPVAGPCTVPTRLVLERDSQLAGRSTGLIVQALPGSTVDVFAYTRPSTTYRLVRSGVTDSVGQLRLSIWAPSNTRLYSVVRGCDDGDSRGVLLNVRSTLSLSALPRGGRTWLFTGDVMPARPDGQTVSLYLVGRDGRQVQIGRVRARPDGTWSLRRTFVGGGTAAGTGVFGVVARTGRDLQNAEGSSVTLPLTLR